MSIADDDAFARDVLRAATDQVARFPPERATNCDVRLDGFDLVFVCESERFHGERVAYRIEAVPDDEADRGSRVGWAGVAGTNWKEALEADEAPSPGSPDRDGLRWLPT
jgi:hypothetical protein